MEKELWRDFNAWLDTANINKLFLKRDVLTQLIEDGDLDRDTVRDAKQMIRMINQEIVARAELKDLINRRRST